MSADDLYLIFPKLKDSPHRITSPIDLYYNCIAYVADDRDHKWWPFAYPPYGRWPDGVCREATVACFIEAFATLGYEQCGDGTVEPGFEKLAIYADGDEVTHMARQLQSGTWSSKLGDLEDIEHDLTSIECDLYGKAVQFLRRHLPQP